MKALYLDGRKGAEVRLDGPALRVESPGRADARYPLGRISRLVTVGRIRWALPALIACLRAGVPIAVLDNAGRFVRIRFHLSEPERGIARHLGELLQISRYRRRYRDWFRDAELAEIKNAVAPYALNPGLDRGRLWDEIRQVQLRGRVMRLGVHYRYLRGLATAHAASMLSRIGLPNDPEVWNEHEYRLLADIVRLEEWRHAALVGNELERLDGVNDRRALTAAFEAIAGERERRITAWRQSLLFQLMGVRVGGKALSGCLRPDLKDQPIADMSAELAGVCHAAYGRIAGNAARVPLARPDSLRTGIKMLKAYLEYDRRADEPL